MFADIEQTVSLMPLIALIFGAIGFMVCLLIIPLVITRIAPAVAHRRELHQTHKAAVPRLGGIGLVVAFVIVTAASFALVPPLPGNPRLVIGLTSLAMFALGLWDDISPIGARKKLLGQILIALAAFCLGLKVDNFKNPLSGVVYELGGWSVFATVFWLVAMTNLINLIDGIDGLAAGISLMLMCLLVYVGTHGQMFSLCLAVGMAGALVAFLYFNFPPAKIYLGDGGAYFLGFLIGGLTIENSNKGTIAAALIAPIFALALPILDTSFSIVRRGLKGLPLFRPDRKHIHHRLLHQGWSRRRTVLTLYAVSLVFLALAFVVFWSGGRLTPILFGCAFMLVLIIVPSFGLIRNWLTVGRALGTSIEMRREIQYALLLRNWMEMEAERCESLTGLWNDFTFVARKLGFTEVVLTHRNARCSWIGTDVETKLHTARHELHITGETVLLDMFAPRTMNEERFQILHELAAEMWQHAAQRWSQRSEVVFALPETPPKVTPADGLSPV
jgi:UDP-GlcNAc:undecaprenyl-phosphate GlcNAc-1-phosphate transferase